MKTILTGGIFALLVAATNLFAADPVLVTQIQGSARLETQATTIEAFTRLNEGSLVQLMTGTSISLLYVEGERQEVWQGPGTLKIGKKFSEIATGQPILDLRKLPDSISRQIGRTPVPSSDGRPASTRTRAFATPENIKKLESDYRSLRASTPPNEREPEVFLLSGLFEMKAFDRLGTELALIRRNHPDDLSIKMLASLYARAINNAKQANR